MKYKIHRFEIKMKKDKDKLEDFLNSLKGEVVTIIRNVALKAYWVHHINFLLIVEKVD